MIPWAKPCHKKIRLALSLIFLRLALVFSAASQIALLKRNDGRFSNLSKGLIINLKMWSRFLGRWRQTKWFCSNQIRFETKSSFYSSSCFCFLFFSVKRTETIYTYDQVALFGFCYCATKWQLYEVVFFFVQFFFSLLCYKNI